MLDHSPPAQTIPPSQAADIAVYVASTALCLAFQGQLHPFDLNDALERGLGSVGLRPVPPHQLVLVWGLAAQVVQDPKACSELLR
jgi:hypothetical protein